MESGVRLRRVRVKSVLSGRYTQGTKPSDWDKRKEGFELILTDAGEEVSLWSSGTQSTPQPGWEILLTGRVGDCSQDEGVSNQCASQWTLYGIATQP